MAIWLQVGYNGEDGFAQVEVGFDRVPVAGERIEFRDPECGETDWNADLDGNVFYVAEVNWIASAEGAKATPRVVLIRKGEEGVDLTEIQAAGYRELYYAFRDLEGNPAALRDRMRQILGNASERGA